MYEVMSESNPKVLAIRVSGKLSNADYDHLHRWLDDQLEKQPSPSILIVMENFEGWDSVGAFIEDGKTDLAYQDDLRRVAMVGESAWQKWMTQIAAPFSKASVRYFDLEDIGEARSWLHEVV